MNEKIKKLAEQVGWHENNNLMYKEDIEKFAKLIVQECSNFVFKNAPSDESAIDLSLGLEEYFGGE